MANKTEKKALYNGICAVCGSKIKAGKCWIAVVEGMPVAHTECYDRLRSDRSVCPSYREPAAHAAAVAEEQARWDAAVAAKASSAIQAPAQAAASGYRSERGSFGGSQDAEDMGDYSGRR